MNSCGAKTFNDQTRKAIYEVENNIDVTEHDNLNDMFKALDIWSFITYNNEIPLGT